MPFITQGKTNIKYLLIVIILAVIVGGGILWWGWSNRFEEKPVSICGPSGKAFWIDVKNCNKSCQTNEDCIFTCGCGAINKNEICGDEGVIYDCVDRDVKCENSICVAGEEKIKDETANWKTYRSEEYGFEIKYPNDLELKEPTQPKDIALESVRFGDNLETSISIEVRDSDLSAELEYMKWRIIGHVADEIKNESPITKDGNNGVRIDYEIISGEAVISHSIVIINNGKYSYVIDVPSSQTDQMLSTFKFIETTEEFCGSSTNGGCASNSDCITGGCSGQVCQSKNEEGVITTCEFKDCYVAKNYGFECKCTDSKCQWKK